MRDRRRGTIRLVDLERVDQPLDFNVLVSNFPSLHCRVTKIWGGSVVTYISICESGRIILHVVITGRSERGAGWGRGPDGAGVVATESGVEDLSLDHFVRIYSPIPEQVGGENRTHNLLILEVTVNVTSTLELRDRFPPRCRVWTPIPNIAWDGPPREEPDTDRRTRPFGGVNAASDRVETSAVGLCVLVLDVATRVAALTRGVNPAISSAQCAGEAAVVGNGAPLRGMQRHGIVSVVINAFDNVDFTIVGLGTVEESVSSW